MSAPVQPVVHTPGPWEIKGPSQNGHCRRIFAGDEYVAIVGGSDQPVKTIRANADLIALAPEMWQAIQGALRIADLWRPSEDTPEEHGEEAKALCMMLSQFEEIARKVV
jgi:hypothetical protein